MLFLILPVSFIHAQLFNADAVHLSPNMDLTIKSLETGGAPLDATLIRHENPAAPNVLYWRLGTLKQGLQILQ